MRRKEEKHLRVAAAQVGWGGGVTTGLCVCELTSFLFIGVVCFNLDV